MEIKSISRIIGYLSREFIDKIESLGDEERKVFEYFLSNISVGALIAIRELKAFYNIEDPKSVIRKLVDIGLLEQGYGCYSLSRSIREELLRIALQQVRRGRDS